MSITSFTLTGSHEFKYGYSVHLQLNLVWKSWWRGNNYYELLGMHSFHLNFWWFIYQNVSNTSDLWNNTCRYEILHTLNLGSCFITLREPCNNQRPRCDIAWLNVTNHLYHGFRVKRLNNITLHVRLFNHLTRKKRGINVTYPISSSENWGFTAPPKYMFREI